MAPINALSFFFFFKKKIFGGWGLDVVAGRGQGNQFCAQLLPPNFVPILLHWTG